MEYWIPATLLGTLAIMAVAGFGMWEPIHEAGMDCFKISWWRVWVLIWGMAGFLALAYLNGLITWGPNPEIIRGDEVPDGLEHLGITGLVVAFFSSVVAGYLPPKDQVDPSLFRGPLYQANADRITIAIAFVTVVFATAYAAPHDYPLSLGQGLAFVFRFSLLLATPTLMYGLYDLIYRHLKPRVEERHMDLAWELTGALASSNWRSLETAVRERIATDKRVTSYTGAYDEACKKTRRARALAMSQIYIAIFHHDGARRFLKAQWRRSKAQ